MEPTSDIPKRLAIAGLILVLALGAWARFDGLGQFSFWTDEMYHVIAAQSILEGGKPVIPARGEYWRSIIATGMTALSFGVFGESEWSARLSFAATSLGFLLVAYIVLAKRFTRLIALLTVLFLAISPQCLQAGRECRMYSLFVLFYFIGVFSAFRAIEARDDDTEHRRRKLAISILLTAIAFGLALSFQSLAINFGISLFVYCLIMCGYMMSKNGAASALRSRYTLILILMVVGIAGFALCLPSIASIFINLARTPMEWDTRSRPLAFCLWFFDYYYPALWFVYPLGAVLLIRRFGRLGLYMVCAFLPVLLAHIFLFTSRIAERYLLYILPFFFLTGAVVIEFIVQQLYIWIRNIKLSGARVTATAALLASLPALWLFMHPWWRTSYELRKYGLGPDWKQISTELQQACQTGIVIANWPREVMYYGGRFPDYFATQSYELENNKDHVAVIGDRNIPVNYVIDAESLESILEQGSDVYFVTTDWAFNNDAFMNNKMRDVIHQHMTEMVYVSSGNDRAVIFRVQTKQ